MLGATSVAGFLKARNTVGTTASKRNSGADNSQGSPGGGLAMLATGMKSMVPWAGAETSGRAADNEVSGTTGGGGGGGAETTTDITDGAGGGEGAGTGVGRERSLGAIPWGASVEVCGESSASERHFNVTTKRKLTAWSDSTAF